MPKQVQDPQSSRALQDLFKLVGRVRPALDEVIVPTVQLADLGAGSAPPVARRAMTAMDGLAAVVGEYGRYRLTVPPGTIAEITRLRFMTANNSAELNVYFGSTTGVLGNEADTIYTDQRAAGTPGVRVYYGTNNTPQVGIPLALGDTSPFLALDLVHPGWIIAGQNGQLGYLELGWNAINEATGPLMIQWVEYQL